MAKRRRKSFIGRAFRWLVLVAIVAVIALWWLAVGGGGHGPVERVHVPTGASFAQVTDSLAAHGIIKAPFFFQVLGHLTGVSGHVRPGTYGFRRGSGWLSVLEKLRAGRVLTVKVVIPEGWTLPRIAIRLARVSPFPEENILALLKDPQTTRRFGVPGPTMEGYLYPATYSWPADIPLDTMLWTMVRRYQRVWTAARRARADSLGMSERDAVTLASIVQAEAKIRREMPIIAGVYRNRLRIGMPLQADPTVQYALRVRKDRLLIADIQSVASDPYNTYTHKGLPPGPIGCPDEQALDAALYPAAVDYLYFVARPDGTDIFSRSLADHNRAKAQARALVAAESAAVAAAGAAPPPPTSSAAVTPPVDPQPKPIPVRGSGRTGAAPRRHHRR